MQGSMTGFWAHNPIHCKQMGRECYGAHVPNLLFLRWDLSFPQPLWKLSICNCCMDEWWQTTLPRESRHLCSLQLWKDKFWKEQLIRKIKSCFTRRVHVHEGWGTKAAGATSNPSFTLSNQHKSQIAFFTVHHPL